MRIVIAGGTGTVGRHIAVVAGRREHELTVLARSTGVDLTDGAQLEDRLRGADAVIDVTSVATRSAKASREFFAQVTSNLLDAGQAAGVRHHLVLSIVGSDRAPFGYYAGKQLQEEMVRSGPVPWTILRTTQFHEFAQQIYGRVKFGRVSVVPRMISQPVAAREVAQRLVQLAEAGPGGYVSDLAGPEVLRLIDMVRSYAAASGANGPILEVPLTGGFGRAIRDGTLTAGTAATLSTLTYEHWIEEIRSGRTSPAPDADV